MAQDIAAQIAARTWSPSSWQPLPIKQQAEYEDKEHADRVIAKLSKLPPLVQPSEVDKLKSLLAECGRGERLIVQGGDCAEKFADCDAEHIEAKVKVLTQMAIIVSSAAKKPALRVARIAGQYGKPRSAPTEKHKELGEIMSYKGENINGYEPDNRKWDPERLVQGYFHSSATLNYMRSLDQAGCTDPSTFLDMDLGLMKDSPMYAQCQGMMSNIQSGASGMSDFYTSHEGMQLNLEEALTRPAGGKFYNLSTHLLWIGDRTRALGEAHIEYFRGIANPVGVKVGPSMKPDELATLVQILNPDKEEGKLMLITRYGADKVGDLLPDQIKAVQATGVPVVWQCDAVHGNTVTAKSVGLKTRKLDDVVREITNCIDVHQQCGSQFGGVHIELTGEMEITECMGGPQNLGESDLPRCYETYCDPRLNYAQSISAAFSIGSKLATGAANKRQKTA